MKVSVVVPVYNEEEFIGACLQALVDQEEKADEILVIDNNCKDHSMEIAAQFPVKIITETTQGLIPARNRGFNEAQYDIIARTDADTIVPRDWIKKIKQDFEGDFVGVSGRASFFGLSESESLKKTYWPPTPLRKMLPHPWMFGPNYALKKSAWEKIKDEVCLDDKKVHEDFDVAMHLNPLGKIKYDEDLIVESSPRRWKKLETYIEYPYRYVKTVGKHPDELIRHRVNKVKSKIINRTNTIKKQFQQLT